MDKKTSLWGPGTKTSLSVSQTTQANFKFGEMVLWELFISRVSIFLKHYYICVFILSAFVSSDQ